MLASRRYATLAPILAAFGLLLGPAACSVRAQSHPADQQTPPSWIAKGKRGMVATDSAAASEAGLAMLKAGGNAVDAAAAVSFTLAVTRPYSTGLGGGGFMILRKADGEVVVLDYRETAPAAADPKMFVRASKAKRGVEKPSRFGWLAVGVPGQVAGHALALERYGSMPMREVLRPAIHLAREGFIVDEHFLASCASARKSYDSEPAVHAASQYVFNQFLKPATGLHAGRDRLVQPELANLLESLADHGRAFFYKGAVATSIEAAARRFGGVITARDLKNYRVRVRKPVVGRYRGMQVISMPPPSSGGVALIESLNILSHFDLPAIRGRDRGLSTHLQIEAMKHAFADRARWMGDPDFVDVPAGQLISPAYGEALARRVSLAREPGQPYGSTQLPDDSGTSHYCVVDRWGNVVVATETINVTFGSLGAVDEWGLIMNNEMDDFSAVPGEANAFGLTQSARNAVEPGKRPLSSMTPTIVLKNGKPLLMLGASGGPRIISSVLNVLLEATIYESGLAESVEALRPHHQWRPDLVVFDRTPDEELVRELSGRGHVISEKTATGVVQAIMRRSDGWIGASDPRKGGEPRGY